MDGPDAGIAVIAALYEQLQVDAEWSVRGPRGFTWWSYRLAQHVEAGPVVVRGGRRVSTVRVWTDIVDHVAGDRAPAEAVAAANPHATLSAVVWDPGRGTISEECTLLVGADTAAWAGRFLAVAAGLQNAAAHARAHGLAEATAGTLAQSPHPKHGYRPRAAELLAAPQSLLARDGHRRSPAGFGAELADALGQFGVAGCVGPGEVSCELPFTGARPVAILMDPHDSVETVLLEAFAGVEHAAVGFGALMTITVPMVFDPHATPIVANRLNLAEARAAANADAQPPESSLAGALLGAWCPDPRAENRDRLVFTAFVPAALIGAGVVEQLVALHMIRARFAAKQLGIRPSGAGPRAGSTIEELFSSVTAALDDGYLPRAAGRRESGPGATPPLRAAPDMVTRTIHAAAERLGSAPSAVQATNWRAAVEAGAGRQ